MKISFIAENDWANVLTEYAHCLNKHSKDIRKLGAESAIPERIEVGLQLGGVALENLDSVKHNILAIKEEIRKNNYSKIEENELFKC